MTRSGITLLEEELARKGFAFERVDQAKTGRNLIGIAAIKPELYCVSKGYTRLYSIVELNDSAYAATQEQYELSSLKEKADRKENYRILYVCENTLSGSIRLLLPY